MAVINLTHDPILNSSAQILVLPVSHAGTFVDSVLIRSRTLYPDNYEHYYQSCRNGRLKIGKCLLHKRVLESTGLTAADTRKQPTYIANMVITDHPHHPTRSRWLESALYDLQQQLIPLILNQGIRRVSILARPLIYIPSQAPQPSYTASPATEHSYSIYPNRSAGFTPLDWHSVILPLFVKYLQGLPKVRIDVHLPKTTAIKTE